MIYLIFSLCVQYMSHFLIYLFYSPLNTYFENIYTDRYCLVSGLCGLMRYKIKSEDIIVDRLNVEECQDLSGD